MTSEAVATLAKSWTVKVLDVLPSWTCEQAAAIEEVIASALASVAQERETELKRLQRIADYHAECRPNREEAEAAIAECERLRAELAQVQSKLDSWRGWAQFVYLGGGPLRTEDDRELRRLVCEANDVRWLQSEAEFTEAQEAYVRDTSSLRAELTKSEELSERRRVELVKISTDIESAWNEEHARAEKAEAELAQAQGYVEHLPDCPARHERPIHLPRSGGPVIDTAFGCSCGLDELLARLRDLPPVSERSEGQ